MKVLMINGSPHANGNTAISLEEMRKVFERIGIGSTDESGHGYEEWFITDFRFASLLDCCKALLFHMCQFFGTDIR